MANTLLIEKQNGGYFKFTLNGDTSNAITSIQNDLLAVGNELHFKTGNGANIIKEQSIYPADVTIVAAGTFTFTTVAAVWNKLIDVGYFDWLGGGVGGVDRFDELLDTFQYTGNAGKAVIVDNSELKLVPITLYNKRLFTELEDTPSSLVPDKMVVVNPAGTALILKDQPEPPEEYLNSVGYFDYNDLATQTTPLNATANVALKLTNDTEGANTSTDQNPYGVSYVWDYTTNQFNFTELEVGDTIDVRVHIQVTTTSANQRVILSAKFGIGSVSEFTNIIYENQFKSAGLHEVNFVAPFYMGSTFITDNPAELYLTTDSSATVKVDGWYVRILRKNINIITVDYQVPDATTLAKGIVRLAGDLGGTANVPTVPELANKVPNTRTVSTTSPLLGGGALSSNLTLSIQQANSVNSGFLTYADWTRFDEAHNDRIVSAAVTGTTTKTLTLNQHDGGFIQANWTDNDTAITLGTPANGLGLADQVLSLGLSSATTIGALSSTDWTTFNSKQGALNGTGFVKVVGTTVSYDNSTYALDSVVVKLTGDQTIAGNKTFTTEVRTKFQNSDAIQVQFLNTSDLTKNLSIGHGSNGNIFSSTGLDFRVGGLTTSALMIADNENATFRANVTANSFINVNASTGIGFNSTNSSTGNGFYSNNLAAGVGFYSNNASTGQGIHSINNSTGIGILSNNNLGGTGINSINSSTGYGIRSANTSTGLGIFSVNTSSGAGIQSTNQSTGDGIVLVNSSTGRGFNSHNTAAGTGFYFLNSSTGKNLVLDNATAATGIPFTVSKNGTDVFTINDAGHATANKFINVNSSSSGAGFNSSNTSTGYGISSNNSSTGIGFYSTNSSSGYGILSTNSSTGNGIYSTNTGAGKGIYSDNSSNGVGFRSDNLSTGRGIYSVNAGTGSGIDSANQSTGIGFNSTNISTGTGINSSNTGAGKGIYASNGSSGEGIYSYNSGLGTGIYSNNYSTGTGIYSDNGSTGYGIRSSNNSTGTGIYSSNGSTGKGIESFNGGAGSGIVSTNSSTGSGIFAGNGSSGNGIYSGNLGTGTALNISNSATGTGIYSINYSSGKNLVLNNTTAATGMPFTIQKNGADVVTISDAGVGVFSSTVQASAFKLTGMTAGSGALYWTSDRVTLANYNTNGVVEIEALGGSSIATFGAFIDLKRTVFCDSSLWASTVISKGTPSDSYNGGSGFGGTPTLVLSVPQTTSDKRTYAFQINTSSGLDLWHSDAAGTNSRRVTVNSSGNVGIGVDNPLGILHTAAEGAIGQLYLDQYGTAGSNLLLRCARGTKAAPTATQSADLLGSIGARGYDGSAFSTGGKSGMYMYAAENFTSTAQGSFLLFGTTLAGTINRAERMRITDSGRVGVNETNPLARLHATESITYGIYGPEKSSIIAANTTTDGKAGFISLVGHSGNASTPYGWGGIGGGKMTAVGNGEYGGYLSLWTTSNGENGQTASASYERMRITSGGDVLVGMTSTSTSGVGSMISQGSAFANLRLFGTGLQTFSQFFLSGTAIGSITGSGSITSYNVTSDYRLKQDFKQFNGLDLVSKIKVYDYAWKVDNSRMNGVIAHELQEVVPYAVTGEKDAMEMQQVDYSKLVPILVQAIQELNEKINKLENK